MILQTGEVLGGLISTLILISTPILIKNIVETINNMLKYYKHHE